MTKIIYIADPEILAIPIIECDESMIDIQRYQDLKYGPPPECELTANCYTKMRQTIYEKLCAAQKDLPKGWGFRLYEGFRSLRVQQMLFDNEYDRVRKTFPEANIEAWFRETTRLVSPVTNLDGSQNIPPHNTGAAVDVEIIDSRGELVDMGMTAADWVSVDPDLCMTHSLKINDTAQANRKILLDVMQSHGFINYPTEWWHFSYGDRYWAFHTNQSSAMYGSAEAF